MLSKEGDLVLSPSLLLQLSLHHSLLNWHSYSTLFPFLSFISGCCHVLSVLQLLWMGKRSREGRAYTCIYSDLSLRHDVDIAVVQGKGHVSENRASIFDHRQSFILDATLRRAVNPNLRQKEENNHEQKFTTRLTFSPGENSAYKISKKKKMSRQKDNYECECVNINIFTHSQSV